MPATKMLNENESAAVVEAIRKAEQNTAGEICVHLELFCKKSPLDKAKKYFQKLKMHKTRARNGVLLYVALQDKKVAVVGDVGINTLVPPNFWESVKENLITHFRKGEICPGICAAVHQIGQQLKTYFPQKNENPNELPDDLSIGNTELE